MTRRKPSTGRPAPRDTQPAPASATKTTGDAHDLDAPPPERVQIELPARTIFKVFACLLLAWVAWQLGPYVLLIGLAILIAVTLLPIVDWLESKGLKRSIGQLLIVLALLALLCWSIAVVIPTVLDQVEVVSRKMPELRERVLGVLPSGGVLRKHLEAMMNGDNPEQAEKVSGHLITAGSAALGALSQAAIVLVIAFYLMVDGPKMLQWLFAFFPRATQAKLRTTSDEVSQVIFAYVWGQAITSALVMVFSFIVLSALKVPGALMLSILAAVFDVLPLLGFFLFTIPACLLAISVSPQAALIVAGLYLAYHALENYFIVPKVYGQRLRLSTLTVLLGLLAGGILAGVPGALLALPVLASYSVVERIWLKPFLHSGVTEKHERLENEEFGEKA